MQPFPRACEDALSIPFWYMGMAGLFGIDGLHLPNHWTSRTLPQFRSPAAEAPPHSVFALISRPFPSGVQDCSSAIAYATPAPIAQCHFLLAY